MNLLGLALPRALELLEGKAIVLETAPPFAPKGRVPVWGEARVVRVRETADATELLVARELLGEEVISSR